MSSITNGINNIIPSNNFTISNGNLLTTSFSLDGGTDTITKFVQGTGFTPTIKIGSTTQSASSQGMYWQINKFVFIAIAAGNISLSGSGNLTIQNLPVSCNATYNNYFGNSISIAASGSLTGFVDIFGLVSGTTVSIYALKTAIAATSMTNGNFSSSTTYGITFSTFYIAA